MPNSPLVDELRHQLTRSARWAERFRRLAKDVASISLTTRAMTCEECGDLLDRLLDDELQNRPPDSLTERLKAHIQQCADCRDSYYLLYTAATATPSDIPLSTSGPVPALSFLRPSRKSDLWRARVRSRLANPAWGLHLSIQISCLRDALSSPPAVRAVRAAELTPAEFPRLLVSDSLVIDAQVVAIEVIAEQRTQQPGRVTLSAVLAGANELPMLKACLRWGDKTYQQPVDRKGWVQFIGLSLAALPDDLSELEIAFESRLKMMKTIRQANRIRL